MSTDLIIADVTILQDVQGRYSLNTLHQASDASEIKRPGQWLKRKSTQALIAELDTQMSFSTCDVVTGGNRAGTYVHELLAVSYAGWISPAFQLRVNAAFLAQTRGARQTPQVRDPAIQMLIDMAVHLDEVRTQAFEAKEEAAIAVAQAARAEQKADLAFDNQNFWTVAEYVQYHDLRHQCPVSAYADASRHLSQYCRRERLNYRDPAVLPRRIPVGERNWETEWGFHTSIYEAAFLPWLLRRQGQGHLQIVTPQVVAP